MVERRGRCGEYGKEIGRLRRGQFQAGLFETLLVALLIPWVNDQSIGANSVLGWGERVARDVAVLIQLEVHPYQIWYVTLAPQLEFPFHSVGPRRPQRLQTILILISAIAKSSPFHFPRRLTDCNDRFLVEHM